MNVWSLYDAQTGIFVGKTITGSDKRLAANISPGLSAMAGLHDHLAQRVDLETGEVVDYRPPPPADTEMEAWAWIDRRWSAQPTVAALWRGVRFERDRRLSATDWRVVVATERGESVPAEWAAYRQALRDVTTQADPLEIQWPTAPEK